MGEAKQGTQTDTTRTPLWHSLRQEAFSSFAFVERNFNLVRRYLSWEIVFLSYNVVNTLTIGLIALHRANLSSSSAEETNQMVLYLVTGALLWGFLSILFNEVSQSVSWERWEGTIEYTFMAPIHRLTYLGGMCLFATLYGLLRTGIILVAVALFFSLNLSGANLLGALLVLAASSLSFMGLGLVAAVLPLMSPERGAQATHILQALILLISGVYYEVEVLPEWLQPLSELSPATYTLRAARAALLQGATVGDLMPTIGLLIGFGALLIPLGLAVFRWGERYAMRTGKLKRSG